MMAEKTYSAFGPVPQWTRKWGMLFLILLVVGTGFVLWRNSQAKWRTASGPIFGTEYNVKYLAHEDLDKDLLKELQRVDNSLSMFNSKSNLSQINTGRTDAADELVVEVLSLARQVSSITGGAFDVTVGPLVNAWGFGFKKGTIPTDAQVDSLLAFVGADKLKLAGNKLTRADERMVIDCGAIAKGYAVDRLANLLTSHGVEHFMIEVGGEVRTHGKNSEDKDWNIGIQRPTSSRSKTVAQGIEAIIPCTDKAMATSGNYRNFYVKDGKRYAHTIDPRTGHPVEHSLLSATVLAPTCAEADAYATAFMVMGEEEAKKILSSQPQLQAVLISEGRDGKLVTWHTPTLYVNK